MVDKTAFKKKKTKGEGGGKNKQKKANRESGIDAKAASEKVRGKKGKKWFRPQRKKRPEP